MSGTDDVASAAIDSASRLKRWLRPLFGAVAGAFVIVTGYQLVQRWDGARVELDPWLALAACLPLALSCIAQGFGWIGLVEQMAKIRVPRLPALALYLASQIARYLPGKVGLPLVRMEGAPRLGLTRSLTGASVVIETLSWNATGAVLGLALVTVSTAARDASGPFGVLSWLLLVASMAGALVLLVVDRSRYPQKLRRLLAPEGHGPLVPLRLPLAQLAYWALVALHGYVLSIALGATPAEALPSLGLYVLASVAGFVVFAAPAGLGVREAVLIAGLSPTLGAAGALGAAAFSRAAWLTADVLTWLLTRTLARQYGAQRDA